MPRKKGASAADIERFESELSGAMWTCPNCGGTMMNGPEGPDSVGENGEPTNAMSHEIICGGPDGGSEGCGLVAHVTLVPTCVFIPEDFLGDDFKVLKKKGGK